LFDSIQKYGINKNIKILLLGGYAHVPGSRDYLNQKFSELNVRDNFLIWEKFVPVETFHSMVKNCDYILPLIHVDHISGSLYHNQISGAYNIAVAYQKPLLVEKAFGHMYLADYKPITYNKDALMETINQLDGNKPDDLYDIVAIFYSFTFNIMVVEISVSCFIFKFIKINCFNFVKFVNQISYISRKSNTSYKYR
jgi:hypothetical protein